MVPNKGAIERGEQIEGWKDGVGVRHRPGLRDWTRARVTDVIRHGVVVWGGVIECLRSKRNEHSNTGINFISNGLEQLIFRQKFDLYARIVMRKPSKM